MLDRIDSSATLIMASFLLIGCHERNGYVDPDGRRDVYSQATGLTDEQRKEAQFAEFKDVLAAVAGVTPQETPPILETWLHDLGAEGEGLLAQWPRRGDGSVDVDRVPMTLVSIDGTIAPGGKSKCGDVAVVYRGFRGPALRMRLDVPGTSRSCRSAQRAARIHDGEALEALRDAIAAARVPADAVSSPSSVTIEPVIASF